MNVGAVAGLAVLLAVPAVVGLLTGATSPFGAAVRLLAALLAAMVVEGVLRRLLAAPADATTGSSTAPVDAAAGVPSPRTPTAPSAAPRALPEDVAGRLRSTGS